MPDFDTRTRQEPDEPNGPRNPSIVSRVRDLLIAMRLRTLLIGGGVFLFVVVAIPVGLLIYPYSGLAPGTVTCDQFTLGKMGHCNAPTEGDTVEVCKADSRGEVVPELGRTPCRVPPPPGRQFCVTEYNACYDTMEDCLSVQAVHQEDDVSASRCQRTSFLSVIRGRLAWAIWLLF
jgi:hypothetical protein